MDKTNYKRPIGRQLILLRTIAVSTLVLLIFLLTKGIYDYSLLVTILLTPVFLISPTQLLVADNCIEIKKYYVLGLITRTYHNFTSIRTHDEEVEQINDEIPWTFTTTITDLTYKDNNGNDKQLSTRLNQQEYTFVSRILAAKCTRH